MSTSTMFRLCLMMPLLDDYFADMPDVDVKSTIILSRCRAIADVYSATMMLMF